MRTDALETALESLRSRGLDLRRASEPEPMPERTCPAVPTGHPSLDAALGTAVAARLGASVEWLLVARPHDPAETPDLAGWLVRSGLLDVLVIDLGERGAPDRRGARLA